METLLVEAVVEDCEFCRWTSEWCHGEVETGDGG